MILSKSKKKAVVLIVCVVCSLLLLGGLLFLRWYLLPGDTVEDLFERYEDCEWTVVVRTVESEKTYLCNETQNEEQIDRLLDLFDNVSFRNVLRREHILNCAADPETMAWEEFYIYNMNGTQLLHAKRISVDGKNYLLAEQVGETSVWKIGTWGYKKYWTKAFVGLEYYGMPME